MNHHRQLPVWNAAMDLVVHLEHVVRHTAQRLCQQVAWANTLAGLHRAHALDELVLTVEEMKTKLTLAQETWRLPISTNSPQPPDRHGGGALAYRPQPNPAKAWNVNFNHANTNTNTNNNFVCLVRSAA